jgi:hypothetical protein
MMNWERVLDWLDNPILVKHIRTRLRKPALASSVAVVVVLSLCIMWGGYQLNWFVTGHAFEMLYLLEVIILFVIGSSQVSTSVAGARISGILDFHRVSPVKPRALALGFFFGAPIREYVLVAATLPFAVVCLAFGAPTIRPLIQLLVLLLASAWFFHGLTLLNGLLTKARPTARGAVVVTVVMMFGLFNALRMSRVLPSSFLFEGDQQLSFFGVWLPWLPVVLLYLAAALYFIDRAACRKMESERYQMLSKPQGCAAMVTSAVLLLGGIWKHEQIDILLVAVLYLLSIVMILLVLVVTPSSAEYIKGLWRAVRQGQSRLPWWHDLAWNPIFVAIACGVVLVTGTIGWSGASGSAAVQVMERLTSRSYSLATATAVLVVAYFGLAYQYFTLRFRARGRIYFSLFLFLVWLVPLLGGAILSLAAPGVGGDTSGRVVISLSPVIGIGMTAYSSGGPDDGMAVRAAALTPALFFAFVFHSLLISARRRAHREFAVALARSRPSGSAAARPTSEIERALLQNLSPIVENEDVS